MGNQIFQIFQITDRKITLQSIAKDTYNFKNQKPQFS